MNNLNKIIEYGLYLFAFLLSWQTRLFLKSGEINKGYSEYLTISIYLSDIILITILVLFFVNFFKSKRDITLKHNKKNIFFILAGLDLFIFISIFFAHDRLLALYKYAIFILGIGLLFLIANATYSYAKLTWSILAGIFFQATLGIYQFLTQSSFSCKWLGLAQHNSSILGTSVIETEGERWLRAYGGLDHPNILGGLLAVGIILLIIKALYIKKTKKTEPFILYFIFCVFLMSLFFTFSRASWLATFIGILIIFLITIIKKNLLAQKKVLKLILIGATLIFILFLQYDNLVFTRLNEKSRLENKSITERSNYVKQAKSLINKNLLFGTGIGNYTQALTKMHPNQPSWYYQPVHNVFLLVFAEIGIFGFVLFILFLLYTLRYKQKNKYKLSLLFILLIIFMFDHWLWSLHFGVFLFWLIMGIFLKNNFKLLNDKTKKTRT